MLVVSCNCMKLLSEMSCTRRSKSADNWELAYAYISQFIAPLSRHGDGHGTKESLELSKEVRKFRVRLWLPC